MKDVFAGETAKYSRKFAYVLLACGLLYPFITVYLKLLFWHDLPEELVHGTDKLWWGIVIHIIPGLLLTVTAIKMRTKWAAALFVAALYMLAVPPAFLLFSLMATCALGVDCI